MSSRVRLPAEDPLLSHGILRNRSWRIKRSAAYLSKYSRSSAAWRFTVENKWCIGFFVLFFLGIVFSFLMRMALRPIRSENQIEIPPLKWYQEGMIYRIYIPSFADSDGNGIGDFGGIRNHLSYLKGLGVSILWLSPIQETNTYGYDVTDFVKTKDDFGYLDSFKSLLNSAQSMEMKVIMDIIINHSSRAHKWFQKSAKREPLFSDYYVWHNATNNWVSVYNGSAWTRNEKRNEYYLHQFRSNEPDLNYHTYQVVYEMKNVVHFWLQLGVDGFYIRDLPFLCESKNYTNEIRSNFSSGTPSDYAYYHHNNTRDLAESYRIIQDIFVSAIKENSTEKTIVLMANYDDKLSEFNYAHQLFTSNSLYRLRPDFSGLQLKSAVEDTLSNYRNTRIYPVWILGNEETSRIKSKFTRRASGLQIVGLLLPGIKSLYYGEEIEMINHPSISFEDTRDPVAQDADRFNYSRVSRDPFRTPMLWNSSKNSGFTTARKSWLPIIGTKSVDSEMKKSTSLWNTIVALIKLKNTSLALKYGWVTFPYADEKIFVVDWTYMIDPTGYLLIWNLASYPQTVPLDHVSYLPQHMEVIIRIRSDSNSVDRVTVTKTDISIDGEEVWILSFHRAQN